MKYEKQAYQRILKNEIRYERQVIKTLTNTLYTINGYMADIYDKYAVNGKLSNAEMTKYNRYASMEKEIFAQIDEATKENLKTIDRMIPDQYNESFFNYAWAMDNANGVRINYGLINKDILIELNTNPFLVSAKQRYALAGKTQLRNALNTGLPLGKSYTQMTNDMRAAVNRLKFEITRMLRTEGQAVVNAGQSDLYTRAQEKGIKGKQVWDATLDGRTRQTHQQMDGVAKSTDGFYHGALKAKYPAWYGLPAGERIQCRCTERFEVEGYSPTIRRTRDQGIIPYQTYPEWRETYYNKVGNRYEIKKDYTDIVRKQYEELDGK